MTSTEHYMAHMSAAELDDYAIRLGAANAAVGRAKTDIAWYAAACLRDGDVPTQRDIKHLREKCAQLDRLHDAAEAISEATP